MLLSNPMTWKLSQMVVPRKSSIFSPEYFTASRASPLDMKFPSPGGSWKMYYNGGGIGLGIVAALEKSGNGIYPVCYFDSGSDPVRCSSTEDIDLSEEYTCVTTRDGLTKFYYKDHEFEFGQNQSDGDQRRNKTMVVAEKSPAKNKVVVFRDSPDFLTSCCLCKKKLQGKDIYMYKGDEGFCSKECRSVKIMEDSLTIEEHKLPRLEVLRSPYAAGIFVI